MSLPNNTLPYTDPATGGTPYFQDNTFVRGDQQRTNNQRIWSNSAALLANDQYLYALNTIVQMSPLINLRIAVSGNTVTLTGLTGSLSASNPGYCLIPSASTAGLLVPVTITADISMTLPSTTPNQRICGINTTDGQATYAVSGSPNNGVTGAIEFFAYVMYDFSSSTPYLGLNKSPMLKVLAADYLYGCTSSTIVKAGSGDTAWNAMITSNSTTFSSPSSVGCIPIGAALTMTVNGGSGTGAGACGSVTIQSGYVPMWNHRMPKVRSEVSTSPQSGYGSIDNKIPKFTNIDISDGHHCQIFSLGGTTAALNIGGCEVYLTVDGYYSGSFIENFGSTVIAGITKNSTQRTTNFLSTTFSNVVSSGSGVVSNTGSSSFSNKFFPAGTILRPHTDGTAASGGFQRFEVRFNGFEAA